MKAVLHLISTQKPEIEERLQQCGALKAPSPSGFRRLAAALAVVALWGMLACAFLGCGEGPAGGEAPLGPTAVPATETETLSPAALPSVPAPTSVPTPEPRIPISQPQLLTFLRRTLHESSRTGFTAKELAMITYVELSGPELTEVPDLALLENLETLVLKETAVTDFSPLEGSARLFSLTLETQPPLDATALAPLKALASLTLLNCPLYNAAALAELPHLKSLTLVDSALDMDTRELKALIPGLKVTIRPTAG